MHCFIEKDTAPPGAAISKRSTRRKPTATLFVLQLSQVSFRLKPELFQSSIFMPFQGEQRVLHLSDHFGGLGLRVSTVRIQSKKLTETDHPRSGVNSVDGPGLPGAMEKMRPQMAT